MKLRVRISRHTSCVELLGEDPSVKDLRGHVRELLASHGLSSDAEFGLSLNGSELLTDDALTLASCGIVSGDLICVHLPPSEAAPSASTPSASTPSASTPTAPSTSSTHTAVDSSTNQRHDGRSPSTSSSQPSGGGGGPAVLTESPEFCEVPNSEPSAAVWEPMLCNEVEDGQAPLSLELLYHTAQVTSPDDAVMVAGHLLMLETGFVPQGGELKPGEMPAGWRRVGGLYRLQYTHPLCESGLASLVAVCMNSVLVINTILKVTETVTPVCKLCLKASSYVTNEWPGGSAAVAFKDLRKLSRLFKDKLAYPVIAAAREAMALPPAFGLPALPLELLLRVLRLLDIHSVVRLSAVNRHFSAAAADWMLWRHLYLRDFKDSDEKESKYSDWKQLYKIRFELQNDRRRRHLPSYFPHYRDGRGFPRTPCLHYPPGIIGGEYDQRPHLPHALLPRPRHDPIGPLADTNRRPPRDLHRIPPPGGRPADVRRGFI